MPFSRSDSSTRQIASKPCFSLCCVLGSASLSRSAGQPIRRAADPQGSRSAGQPIRSIKPSASDGCAAGRPVDGMYRQASCIVGTLDEQAEAVGSVGTLNERSGSPRGGGGGLLEPGAARGLAPPSIPPTPGPSPVGSIFLESAFSRKGHFSIVKLRQVPKISPPLFFSPPFPGHAVSHRNY